MPRSGCPALWGCPRRGDKRGAEGNSPPDRPYQGAQPHRVRDEPGPEGPIRSKRRWGWRQGWAGAPLYRSQDRHPGLS